jgi:DNA-binding response OmpR family regulator
VDVATEGSDGSMKARVHPYDLFLLDVMLPGRIGLRDHPGAPEDRGPAPILLLTARDSKEDIVAGLDAGADDYLTKPFSLDEVLARVRALLRRGGAPVPSELRYADVVLDRLRHEAFRDGTPLDLTPREFALLEFTPEPP